MSSSIADFFLGTETYPPVPFYFRVDFIGLAPDQGFSEVSGLEVKMETTEIIEGGENNFVHRVPGRIKYENLTLKGGLRPLSSGSALITWCAAMMESGVGKSFKIKTCQIDVSLLNEKGLPTATWNFTNAYPVRWKTADLNSTEDGSVLIEEIEFCYQKHSRVL